LTQEKGKNLRGFPKPQRFFRNSIIHYVLFFEIFAVLFLAQEKYPKNIGCKLFAINSALRTDDISIQLWEMNSPAQGGLRQHFPNLIHMINHNTSDAEFI
jgi:hypothetical protein